MTKYLVAFLVLLLTSFNMAIPTAVAETISATQETQVAQATKVDPRRLLVRPKNSQAAPKFTQDPGAWIRQKQRVYYGEMSKALLHIKRQGRWQAAWFLMLMSFVYGVLHAAGPGHGKAVVSAWLLANEQQLRRGIIIAAMAAIIQALSAIVIVTTVLAFVKAAGSQARFIAASLTSISFGLIGLVGLYLVWRTLKTRFAGEKPHVHDHHEGHSAGHVHDHDDNGSCACGHVHMPDASQVSKNWSWSKAFALAFAVGIRPCSGAILVLLLSATINLYWAGVASTFFMAIGTAITVSLVAVLTVYSKNVALKLTGDNNPLFLQIMFAVKLLAGIFIALTGAFLFWASLPRIL